jgi:hypothetical protein
MMADRYAGKGMTKYSATVPGTARNYNWPIRFDKTDGFVGITQLETDGRIKDRVLLSPKQITELLLFAGK